MVEEAAVVVEFKTPASLLREQDRPSMLPIVGNGPPGTFVIFPEGFKVSLPTDQIVFADDSGGRVRVGFGGMQLVGAEEESLVFVRVREILPEDRLSPDRSHRMLLDTRWVVRVTVDGEAVWQP